MKQKLNILVTAEMGHLAESRAILEKSARITYAPSLSRRQLLHMIPEYDALLTNLRQRIDRAIIKAGRKLKVIATPSTGTDHIDTAYAVSKGIAVQSLKSDYSLLKTISSTAEHAFLLMLACLRKLPFAFNDVKRGRWHSAKWRGREAAGRTVGIIGYGRLGRIFARLARGFGMKVMASDPFRKIKDRWVEQVNLKELLKRAEIITIHVHLTPETRGLIGVREFGLMRRGVYLINTSRGALIDESALLRALKSGKIAGAGIDVLTDELEGRPAKNPLVQYARSHNNLIITPHIGGGTYDAQEKAFRHTAQKIVDFIKKKEKNICRQTNLT
jgi:D-3-phosphoglycerate dehydrogenase